MNPDGGEYDIADRHLRLWRKNRQPNAGSTYIGTDLNRNWSYRWGCCGGSQRHPSSETYRGPAAFSAPETQVVRDFVDSRVIGGVQQIKAAHRLPHLRRAGAVALWLHADRRAGRHDPGRPRRVRRPGPGHGRDQRLHPEQASDLYITDGTAHDWDYHTLGVFHFTFEMGPAYRAGTFYPTGDQIGALTAVNRGAVLYLIAMADCPERAAGLEATYCGAAVAASASPAVLRMGATLD